MTKRQRSLLIEEYPLLVLPDLARRIGLNEAIVLQQVHYWLPHGKHEKDGRPFIYKTFEEWQQEFPFWSEKTIKRIIAGLRDMGLLIISKRDETSWDRTNWYSIDYAALAAIGARIGSKCPDASGQDDLMHEDALTHSMGSTCPDQKGQSDPKPSIGTETTSKTTHKRVRVVATTIPTDFAISPAVRAWAKRKGFEPYLQAHLDWFVDYANAARDGKPPRYADWDAAFRNAIRGDWGGVRKGMRGVTPPAVAPADITCKYVEAGAVCGMPNARMTPRYHEPICAHHEGKLVASMSRDIPPETRDALRRFIRKPLEA